MSQFIESYWYFFILIWDCIKMALSPAWFPDTRFINFKYFFSFSVVFSCLLYSMIALTCWRPLISITFLKYHYIIMAFCQAMFPKIAILNFKYIFFSFWVIFCFSLYLFFGWPNLLKAIVYNYPACFLVFHSIYPNLLKAINIKFSILHSTGWRDYQV